MKNPIVSGRRACRATRNLMVALAFWQMPTALRAEGEVAPPLLEFSSGLPGKQVHLSWAAVAGVRYRIEKSTELGVWSQVALVEAGGVEGSWLDPQATGAKAFYRVMQPEPEVFSVTPPVLGGTGGMLVIRGQLIPQGSYLSIGRDGLPPLLVLLEAQGGGVWHADVPGGLTVGEALTLTLIDGNGLEIHDFSPPIEVTETGLATDSPPSLPPAAPMPAGASRPVPSIGIVVKRNKVRAARSVVDNDDSDYFAGQLATMADIDDSDSLSPLGMAINEKGLPAQKRYTKPNSPKRPGAGSAVDYDDSDSELAESAMWLGKRGYDYYKAKSDLSSAGMQSNPYSAKAGKLWNERQSAIHKAGDQASRAMGPGAISPAPSGLPGEVSFQFCALSLATPAGPPLEMVHTYRSMPPGGGGTAGSHWESCYDVSIEPVPLSAGSSAPRLKVCDGGGRCDVFYRQSDGSYRCRGMFREGRFNGETFTLTFADKGRWVFTPLDDATAPGRLSSITDRNQVSLSCTYDGSGHLSMVSSQFGQSLTMAYGPNGSLGSVTDHTGRSVQYSYYAAGEADGNPGDLKTISAPQAGPASTVGPTTFTYTTRAKSPALDGNLLSITDGAGRLLEAFTYAATSNPADIDFDTCDSHDRNRVGHVTLNRREIHPPGSSPASAYTVFEVDELGRLTEIDFDREHREVAVREFTGFCTPNVPVTSSANRPTGKLHASDPDFFETTCAYNADGLCSLIVAEDGSQQRVTYDGDFRKGCPVRERANARTISLLSPGGELRSVSCDYLPGFGTPECFMPGGPVKGIQVKCGRNPGGDAVARGHKGWDGSIKGNYRKGWDGSVKGKLVDFLDMDSDDDGFALLKKEEGGRHTPFHNKYRPQFRSGEIGGITGGVIAGIVVAAVAPGEDEDCDGRADDEDSRRAAGKSSSTMGAKAKAWMVNNFVTRQLSAYGQATTCGYDGNGNLTSVTSPVPGRGSLYQYNTLGQLTGRTVLNGAAPTFSDEVVYNPASGFPSSVVFDSSGLHITTAMECDTLGRVIRVVDPNGHDWLYGYNDLDTCVQIQTPPGPSRISMNMTVDSAGRVCRCDVEHRAPDGSLDAANPVYTTFWVRDDRCHLIQVAAEARPVNSPPAALAPAPSDLASYDVCDITLDAAGQVTRVSTPAACRNQAVDRVCDFTYNERGLLDRCIDGGLGTVGAVTNEFEYDAIGALVRCATLDTTNSPQTLITYDGFHRLSSITDPMGNVTENSYGNDGSVTSCFYGEVTDVEGGSGNVLLAKSKHQGDYLPAHNWRLEIDRTLPPGLFFGVETEDDTLTVERFSPGSTAPPVTEVTVVDRSPAGLIQQITCNGDVLATLTHDTAGRSITCSNGACSRTVTRNAGGQITVCGDTDHFSVSGMPDQTFTVSRVLDAFGRCTQTTDGVGNTTLRAYDSLGRCVSETEPGGLVVLTDYDGSSAAGPFSTRVSADYDGDGNPEVLSACLARCGELSSVTDSHGFATTFTSDALGRCVRCDRPDGTFESVAYDGRGFRASGTDADGSTRSCTCDLNGRVTTIDWADLPSSVAAVPKKFLQHDGLGNLTRCVQGASTVTLSYDSCGDPVSETQDGFTVSRSFNHRGCTGITYPDGKRFAEVRDAFGRLVFVSGLTPAGQPVSPPVVSFSHAGYRVFRSVQRNGVTTIRTYRADGEVSPAGVEDHSFGACVRETVTDASSNVLLDTLVCRDANQRTCSCQQGYYVQGQEKIRLRVTPRDRFGNVESCVISHRDSATLPPVVESSVSYVYDPDGTRLSEIRNSVAGDYTRSSTLPPGDQQMGQYSTWPGGALEWDDNGNLATFHRGTEQLAFVHDAEGRVVSVSNPATGPVITYNYDALGRRVGRNPQTGGTIQRFVYSGSVCIQELGADNLADMTFVCADGIRQCISTRNGTIYYPHGGGNGSSVARAGIEWEKWEGLSYIGTCDASLRLITSATGTPVERFDCDESGKPIFLTAEGSPSSSNSSSIGLRWLAPECAWEPELAMYACPGCIYSPELAMNVSRFKAKLFLVGVGDVVSHEDE